MDLLINKIPYDEEYTECMCNTIPLKYDMIEIFPFYDREWNLNYRPYKSEILASKKMFDDVFGECMERGDYGLYNYIWTFATLDRKNVVWPLINREGISWEYDRRSNIEVAIKIRQWVESEVKSYYV